MRILHVTPYFEDAWAYGGIPRAAAATVRGLADRGHAVTVCTTDAYQADTRLPTRRAAKRPRRRAEVRIFPNVSNALAYHLQFFQPRGLARYLAENADGFDVAHLHGYHHVPGALAARALRRAGIPFVLTPHGTAPHRGRFRLIKWAFNATIGRDVLAGAERVIAVSRAERAQLLALGVPAESIAVIPNPLHDSEFDGIRRGAFRRSHGVGAHERVIVYLGTLTAQKRLDVLVEAFASLGRTDVRLVIAGNDMGYGRTLQQLIDRFGIRDRTVLTGLLASEKRLHALADADVVSYASENEVFGLVPVEALLCGTPVVVSDDSGCGEVVAETGGGLLVPPANVERLRDALHVILDNPRHWRTAAAGARQRARRYSSARVCEAIERTYAEVTGQRDEPRLYTVA